MFCTFRLWMQLIDDAHLYIPAACRLWHVYHIALDLAYLATMNAAHHAHVMPSL